MAGEHDRGPAAAAGALAQHVADGVHAHPLESERGEPLPVLLGAHRFLERRRGDLAEGFLLREGPGVVGLELREHRVHGSRLRGQRRGKESDEKKGADSHEVSRDGRRWP
jgi:hypothetical protein